MITDFEKLIDKNKYQVFVMCCPAYFPFNFFRHPWFVLNEKGNISRWEVRHSMNKQKNNHLFINNQNPFEGINKSFCIGSKWDPKLIKIIEGDLAEKVITVVKNSQTEYPHLNEYYFSGPNSNTYLKWVLDKFPELGVELSWRFIGKNYKYKLK